MSPLRIGTRGSALALAQARLVEARLKAADSRLQIEVRVIQTSGDLFQGRNPATASTSASGVKGLFVKEIEEALLDKDIDLAVHSAKDLPTQIPEGLSIAAYLEREDPRDVFIGREGLSWADLGPGRRVGTSSLRREIQSKRAKPGIEITPLRGNVDTRLRKLEAERLDGVILAAAGLRRLNLSPRGAEPISTEEIVPAPGQGAVAVEAREKSADLEGLFNALDHPATRAAVECERSFSKVVGGGCSSPLGAYARTESRGIRMRVFFSDEDGRRAFYREAFCADPASRDFFIADLARPAA